ncbi:lipocalin family protein [Glaciecola sp. XM2]|jgi:apolipoprotein D and lipocalin family protein|uniref:lipocalin family protein n=1 Tax=Glaciecola sp. XM2 TaxID=1914931 RepID=UPI001BDE69C4|nr:lipocalin family protein [Glaciecola sp. XM2]MBT1451190.1 lipocalin family protein [Glaciecola sp. XM2]
MFKRISILVFVMLLGACTGIPEGVQPIKGFEKEKYLGTWYEIARLDHSFERGLNQVTATYTLREDGGIDVLNKGFNTQAQEWEYAEGKAYFVGDESVGHLKVSFFGPFYASYVIADLDKDNYQYALVTGPDTGFLWILARTPQLDAKIVDRLVQQANELGFDTEQLIYVKHGF